MELHKEAEEDDPLELQGIGIPDPSGESTRRMAECFAEEFLRMGFPPGRVLALFESPGYALAHRAYEILGSTEVRAIVDRAVSQWSPRRK